jgi:hypothetical protein
VIELLFAAAGRLVVARERAHGAEVVATARAAAAGAGTRARLMEVASLVAFALRARRARTIWLEGALLAVIVALLAEATPLALVLPFLLLPLGARPAAAATLFWLWRLVTADVGELLAALDDPTLAVARWLLMLAGLAVAVHVTRSSMRRAAIL